MGENPQRIRMMVILPSVESLLPSWWGSQTQPPDGLPHWHSLRTPTARNFWSGMHQSELTSGWHVLQHRKSGTLVTHWSLWQHVYDFFKKKTFVSVLSFIHPDSVLMFNIFNVFLLAVSVTRSYHNWLSYSCTGVMWWTVYRDLVKSRHLP